MIFQSQAALKERITELSGRKTYGLVKVVEDTSNYMSIHGGMVLRLEGDDFMVLGDATEGRFGISDQPKFWVKNCIDLTDGSRKIVKLVFHEQFSTRLGPFTVRCRRSAQKESQVLDAVAGDLRFMQGRTVTDSSGNNVRIIDFIKGRSFYQYLASLPQSHETYFFQTLPDIFRQLIDCVQAMALLHRHGLQHGDIRNDHIFVESGSGRFRWIDFDYTVNYSDYDLWSMGNVLNYAVAKGIMTWRRAVEGLSASRSRTVEITPDDALLFYSYRLANLQKVYPYIPSPLNDLLMRFSAGTEEYFMDFDEQVSLMKKVYRQTWG